MISSSYPGSAACGLGRAPTGLSSLLKFSFGPIDKFGEQRRLHMKDPAKVMEDVATDQDWKICFAELAPGLALFARQFVRSIAEAEDIVQEAFVRLWRQQHSIQNR